MAAEFKRSADGAGDEEQAGAQLQDQIDQAIVGRALTGTRQVHGNRPADGEAAVGGEAERLVGLVRGELGHPWPVLPWIPNRRTVIWRTQARLVPSCGVNVPGPLASLTGERFDPARGDGTATPDLRQRRLAPQRAPLDETP